MPAYTDDPATSSTHIRAVHINELRRDVAFFRQQFGLSPITWLDGTITNQTRVRAAHFTQLASAMQDLWTAHHLGNLPQWSAGSAPLVLQAGQRPRHQRPTFLAHDGRSTAQHLDRFPLV